MHQKQRGCHLPSRAAKGDKAEYGCGRQTGRLVDVWQPLEILPPKNNSLSTVLSAKQMTLETGEIGRQANGAVNLTYGDTVGKLCALGSQIVHSKPKCLSSLHSYNDE